MVHPEPRLLPRLTLQQPPLSSTVEKARATSSLSPAPSALDVVYVVSEDPMALLWLMKRANSAYYGLGNLVDSISHAVEIMGVSASLRLLQSVQHHEDHPHDSIPARLNRHAALTARLAHRITHGVWPFDKINPCAPGTVFTAGMLHGLGRMALVYAYPQEADLLYRSSFLRADSDDGEWQHLERLQFGADHLEIGEIAARKLRLPDSLIRPSGERFMHSHSLPLEGAAVDVARKIVNSQGYGLAPRGSMDRIPADASWIRLVDNKNLRPDELPELVEELKLVVPDIGSINTHVKDAPFARDREAIGSTGTPGRTQEHSTASEAGSLIQN